MIHTVDQQVTAWADAAIGSGLVTLGPPRSGATGRGVSIHLLEVTHTPPARTARRPIVELTLRYLVSTWADDAAEGHRILGLLLVAALQSAAYEVEVVPPSIALWEAFGVGPGPAFLMRVPARAPLPERDVPVVRAPMVMDLGSIDRLQGVVLGPEDMPLVSALVELPALNLSTRTDVHGHFLFPAIPPTRRPSTLRVTTKGRVHAVDIEYPAGRGPIRVHVDPMED